MALGRAEWAWSEVEELSRRRELVQRPPVRMYHRVLDRYMHASTLHLCSLAVPGAGLQQAKPLSSWRSCSHERRQSIPKIISDDKKSLEENRPGCRHHCDQGSDCKGGWR